MRCFIGRHLTFPSLEKTTGELDGKIHLHENRVTSPVGANRLSHSWNKHGFLGVVRSLLPIHLAALLFHAFPRHMTNA